MGHTGGFWLLQIAWLGAEIHWEARIWATGGMPGVSHSNGVEERASLELSTNRIETICKLERRDEERSDSQTPTGSSGQRWDQGGWG